MVDRMAKGQLLERPVIIPFTRASGETACLDGIYLRGSEPPPLLVGSPHPLLGGSMQNAVVNELAYAAARAGRASLRFDYEGVGASEGEPSADPEQAVRDMLAALQHLIESAEKPRVAVAGYSFGCVPALLLAARESKIDRLLLVAPPRRFMSVPDYSTVKVPVTVVVGDKDEIADPAAEKQLAEKEPTRVRLEVIRDADHSFRFGMVQISRIAERTLGALHPA